MATLTEKLRIAREKAGLTQQQAADKTGIGYKTINNYENGVSRPDVEKLAALCKAYNVSADYFLNLNETATIPYQSTKDEPTPEEIQFLLEEMRAGRGSKEASILYYGGKPKPADEKMLEIEKAIDRRNNLQSMAEKTAELILDGETPAMLVSYINDKWEQIPLTEDELKAIRILLQK